MIILIQNILKSNDVNTIDTTFWEVSDYNEKENFSENNRHDSFRHEIFSNEKISVKKDIDSNFNVNKSQKNSINSASNSEKNRDKHNRYDNSKDDYEKNNHIPFQNNDVNVIKSDENSPSKEKKNPNDMMSFLLDDSNF
jgi:hypothetical protein